MTEENNIQIIKNIVSEYFPENEIILFGSRARRDNAPDSDYDLMIIIPGNISDSEKIDISCRITSLLAKHRIPADVLIQNRNDVETKKFYIGSVVREAMKEGIRI